MIISFMFAGFLLACYWVLIRPDATADRYVEICRKERELREQIEKESQV